MIFFFLRQKDYFLSYLIFRFCTQFQELLLTRRVNDSEWKGRGWVALNYSKPSKRPNVWADKKIRVSDKTTFNGRFILNVFGLVGSQQTDEIKSPLYLNTR